MNDLVRATSYYTGGIAASAPAGVLATIPNPPPDIARLPSGTTLRGVVIGSDGKGHVLVKTDQGTLTVATKAQLPKNSEVVLQIRSSGTQLHIMIMQARNPGAAPDTPPQPNARAPGPAPGSVGGGTSQTQPGPPGPQTAPAPSLDARGGGATSSNHIGSSHTGPLNLGQVVRALVQGPAGPMVATVAQQPGVQAGQPPRPEPGTILPLRILSVSASGPAPSVTVSPHPGPTVSSTQGARAYTPYGPQGPPGIPSPAKGPVSTGHGGSGAGPGAVASSGAAAAPTAPAPALAGALPGQVPGVAGAPGTALPTAPGPAAHPAAAPFSSPVAAGTASGAPETPLRFTGLVTGATPTGRPILSTPLGTLSLEVEARLPGGSRVALELAPGALLKAAEPPPPIAAAHSLAHAWPALEEALAILADASATATQGTPQGVPQPGTRLTSGMLFFMAALSGGNLGRWLGADALQTLRASGRDTLIGRLSRDLTQMARMAEGTGGSGGAVGDWRLLPIPLWHESHVHQLRLFLRQHEDRHDGGKKHDRRDPTRFILELEMSRLGEMQLDGLIRDKRFDLMMRTRGALPEDMRQDIRWIFEDANQAAGYSGSLGFQASADWHFLPIDQDDDTGEPPGLLV